MTDEKPRHARIAADFWDHPRTEWMHPLHRDVFTQALAANALGLLELPMARIAKRCKSTEEQIATAMHQMDDDGVAVWWRDLGIFWVVNAPEHNCFNQLMWKSAYKIWRAQPAIVRDKVAQTWPNVTTGALPHNAAHDAPHQPSHHTPKSSVSVSDPSWVVNKGAREDVAVRVTQERVREIVPPDGCKHLLARDDKVRALIRAGATPDEIVATCVAHRDRVNAGEEPREHWRGTYVFSGFYDRLRDAGEAGPRRESL